MGHAIEQLRHAIAAQDEPTLASVGGTAAVLAAADELPATAELPFVVSMVVAEWDNISERTGLIDLIIASVDTARPFELDDLLDLLLSHEGVVPDLAARLEGPLRNRAAGDDAAAGIALEAWLRLSLGRWARPLPLLGKLDEHAAAAAEAESDAIDPAFLHRLVRCLGAAGEHWRAHGTDLSRLLRGLLRHRDIDDNVAFELAMLELHTGLESADPQQSLQALVDARTHFALCAQYEDRIDAEIFKTAVDALVAFVNGVVPTHVELDRLRELVLDYRLYALSEYPHWRQPRADTAVHWLSLVDMLAALQDLDSAWYHPAELIAGMAAVYQAHRTLTLIQPADVVSHERELEPTTVSAALPALLQPRIISAVVRRSDGQQLLERWLGTIEKTSTDPDDTAAIREILDCVRAGNGANVPKVVSADVSALAELLVLSSDDAASLASALGQHPEIARKLNFIAAARAAVNAADVGIYFQREFGRVLTDLLRASSLVGEPAVRVEQLALCLMRYMRWRGSVTAGSQLAASFQRTFSDDSDAPKETEFADDLHLFLAANLPVMPYKEVSHIANGRVDLICHFGTISLVIECKRELENASMEHLASLYAFQAAEYDWADPGVAFLIVLDLTKESRRVPLGEAVRVVMVPSVEAGGQPETVMVAKVQANLPSPSYQSTPTAARARRAAGIAPTDASMA